MRSKFNPNTVLTPEKQILCTKLFFMVKGSSFFHSTNRHFDECVHYSQYKLNITKTGS